MATAEELLSAISEESAALVVDLNTRVISIPASISVLGVESDDDTRRLRFEVPQFYQGLDLSEFKIQVNFSNARGKGDFYPIKDVVITNDVLSFVWEVDRSAYAYKGDVEFSLCMKKYAEDGSIERELNTTTTTLPVLKGLETTKEVVENNPSAFDAVLFRLYAVESATGLGQNGYYSIVQVTESVDGTLFTIMNSDGTTAALVKHGKDGITPIKGVDYFTDAEKTAFQSDIERNMKAYVDNWAPHYVTVTLTSTNWVGNKQTVAVEGVTENNPIFPAPVPTDGNYEAYNDAEIRCIAQAVGSLTFQCGSTPSSDIKVNVAVYYSYGTVIGAGDLTVTDDGNGNVTIM